MTASEKTRTEQQIAGLRRALNRHNPLYHVLATP